jgi:hypothetical protein
MSNPFFLEGEAGRIEVWTHLPVGGARAAALCFHPHPLYGGNIQNKVLYEAREAIVERGVACYSMNFRGVGLTAGEYAMGEGEYHDALLLHAHIQKTHAELPLWVVGYSFGAWMALRLAAHHPVERAVCVGLPLTVYDFSFLRGLVFPIHVFQGEWDEMGSPGELMKFFAEGYPGVDLTTVAGADHFFNDALSSLAAALARHPVIGSRPGSSGA